MEIKEDFFPVVKDICPTCGKHVVYTNVQKIGSRLIYASIQKLPKMCPSCKNKISWKQIPNDYHEYSICLFV